MRISELPKYLSLLPPHQSVLIVGPPGCGKSTAVREFAELEAKRLGREFVDYDDDDELFLRIAKNPERYYVFLDLRLSECEPTDFLGVPRDIDHFIVYKPLRWVQVFSYEQSAGLIFLDEITNVRREDVLAQAYKLVLDRRAGLRKFSDGVRVVAAGNHPEHSSIANLLPAPLANRFAIIGIDATDPYEWIEYVNSKEGGIDPRVAGYIARFPGDLLQKCEAETLENYPTPRSWSRLNRILRENDLGLVEVEEVARMLLGSVVAQKFAAFCRLKNYLPPPDQILKDPDLIFSKTASNEASRNPATPSRLDLIYYAIASVASYVSTGRAIDLKEVAGFAVRLAKEQADLFVVFLKLLPKSMRDSLMIKVANVKEVQQVVMAISRYI
jgi:energy-coupling factor transporter ATP-binding protein EcfA2